MRYAQHFDEKIFYNLLFRISLHYLFTPAISFPIANAVKLLIAVSG